MNYRIVRKGNAIRSWILLLFLIIASIAQGQDDGKSRHFKTQKIWPQIDIGAHFTPGVSYRSSMKTDNSYFINYANNPFNYTERPQFAFVTSLDVMVSLCQYFDIRSGLQYANQGFHSVWFPSLISSSTGSYNGFVKTGYTFHYLQVPVRADFKVGKKKVKFIASAGIAIDIFVADKYDISIRDSSGRTQSYSHTNTKLYAEFNRFNLSVIGSVGMEYDFKAKMKLRIEPTFCSQVTRFNQGKEIKYFLWNAGLNVAYYFGVK